MCSVSLNLAVALVKDIADSRPMLPEPILLRDCFQPLLHSVNVKFSVAPNSPTTLQSPTPTATI